MRAIGVDSLVALSTVAQFVAVALGLAVIFGLMRVINFAHGEFITLGAFAMLILTQHGAHFWLALALAPVILALIGYLVERAVIRFLYGRLLDSLLATFGLSLITVQILIIVFGVTPQSVDAPFGSVRIGSYRIEEYRLVLTALVALLVVVTWLVFTRTMYGIRARAALSSPEAAVSIGIDRARINSITFALGSALAGAAGALLTPLLAVEPYLGQRFLARAFLTVVVGGEAAVTGTLAAATVLGTTQYVTTVFGSAFLGIAAVLIVAIVILRIFPTGLSARWRTKV